MPRTVQSRDIWLTSSGAALVLMLSCSTAAQCSRRSRAKGFANRSQRAGSGFVLFTLENDQPALAVARGAARFGALLHHRRGHIAAGVAHAAYSGSADHGDGCWAAAGLTRVRPSWGAGPDEGSLQIGGLPLGVRTDQPPCASGSIPRAVTTRAGPETSLRGAKAISMRRRHFKQSSGCRVTPQRGANKTVPVRLVARMNALGRPRFLHQRRGPREPAVLAIGIQYGA